jgi:lipoprotein-anchoring transpeptidase ErfK/SrfK
LSYRKYRMTRKGARAVTLVAVVTMALVAIEAAARAQEADSRANMADPDRVVADGVTVAGIRVAGMTAAEVEYALRRHASRPVTVAFRSDTWRYTPETLGAQAEVDTAVEAALGAPKGATLPLKLDVNERKLQRWTRSFARSFDQKRRNAKISLEDNRPTVTRARLGRELERWSTRTAVLTALENADSEPVQLPVRILRPTVTNRDVGLAIVIKRASNQLVLYRPGGKKGMRVMRKFGVATGQAAYPTPLGNYEIVNKQANPWWYPPDSDWAKDAEPIPPGPGNPLGTRWMGLSAPAVGIHGTPDAASIGYSASHGCIRMLVPEAEWLFEHVTEGTPVYILDA